MRPLGLGDLLTGIPAMRALAYAFPDYRKVLAAPAALAPLATLSGAVDEVVPTEPLVPLDPVLHGADVAVDLHGRGPASHRVLLASRPKRLVAFANSEIPESRGFPEWRQDEHEVVRWCRMLEESGIPADHTRLDLEPPPGHLPAGADGATIIHPGAAFPARRWPVDRWAEVARSERKGGRRVILTGGPDERSLAEAVAGAAGLSDQAVQAGRTNLAQLAVLVAAAGRVICADTGIAHLATALRTPSVVLFGPTSPRHWGPPPDRPWHRALWAGTTGNPHGEEPDPGLLAITVDQVTEALSTLPPVSRPPPPASGVHTRSHRPGMYSRRPEGSGAPAEDGR